MVDPDLIWSLPDGEIRRYDRRYEHNLSRVPEERSYAACTGVLSGEFSGGGTVSEINYQASIAAGIRIKGE